MALPLQTDEQYYLGPDGIWNSWMKTTAIINSPV